MLGVPALFSPAAWCAKLGWLGNFLKSQSLWEAKPTYYSEGCMEEKKASPERAMGIQFSRKIRMIRKSLADTHNIMSGTRQQQNVQRIYSASSEKGTGPATRDIAQKFSAKRPIFFHVELNEQRKSRFNSSNSSNLVINLQIPHFELLPCFICIVRVVMIVLHACPDVL